MYLASEINEILESKKSKLVGNSSFFYITTILNKAFKDKDPYKFKYETFDDYSKDDFSVSGLYDMDMDKKYVILNFSKNSKTYTIEEKRWEEFKFTISQVCQHESIHQNQWQHREYTSDGPMQLDFRNLTGDISEEKEYLSDVDEIDAYAHDIAMEIKFYYSKKNPYEILKTIDSRKKIWSYTYYKKAFKGDDWSKIKSRLLKKTFQWMPYVQV